MRVCLDSLLNFEFCFNLRDYLRKPGDQFGNAWGLRRTTDSINAVGARCVLQRHRGCRRAASARQDDQLFREPRRPESLSRSSDVDDEKQKLANVIMMTSHGIPVSVLRQRSGIAGSRKANVGRD
jgi:alpha-amylase